MSASLASVSEPASEPAFKSASGSASEAAWPDLAPLLERVVADRVLHAKWINTFSLLESIGFRKIIKSHRTTELTADVLQHAFEESRHALLLKKLAVRIGGPNLNSFDPDHLFCGEAAASYFHTLDAACAEELKSAKLCYLYVTWLVEVRALEVYEAHRRAAEAGDPDCQAVASQLARLLREEEGHLVEVEASLRNLDPEFEKRAAKFQKIERLLFATFFENAKAEVQNASA